MRKFIYPWDTIKANMATWWIEYKVEASEGEPQGKGVLHNGMSMFMPGARAALRAGYKSAQYLADLLGNMYNKLEPKPFSKHGLSKWVAARGESSLEKFHHLLAHFGNMGMGRELADSLGLRGTCRYNLKIEWKWTPLADRPEEIGDFHASTTSRHWRRTMIEPGVAAAPWRATLKSSFWNLTMGRFSYPNIFCNKGNERRISPSMLRIAGASATFVPTMMYRYLTSASTFLEKRLW
jgi:hypothetical protein